LKRLLPALIALLALGACAGDIPFKDLESRYANAASRFAEMPGDLRVHYRDQGPSGAPVVVFVHGFAANLDAWEPWAMRLQGDYRLISLDLPGHGLTRTPAGYKASLDRDVELVADLTRRLGAEHFVVVGNSMGGAVAWNFAMTHPERLRGLVLVDAAGWPGQGRSSGPPGAFKLLANPVGRSMLRSIDPKPLAKRGLKSAYLDETLVTPALINRYVQLARAPGHRDVLTSQTSSPGRPVTAADFNAIRTPTLVMAGENDKLIPVADARAFAAAIPGARLVTYAGVGHVPMEQLPDRSAQDLRAFLAELPR